MRKAPILLLAAAAGVAGVAHSQASTAKPPTLPKPDQFVRTVTNPYFPLRPGTVFTSKGQSDGRPARDVLRVTHATKVIEGIRTTVIDDRVYVSGRLEERTTDWYAQDKKGNVWYLGEATATLDKNGKVRSREGSWQAGRNGALPGIYMPADPRVGQSARQELYKGHAEDHFRVLGLRAKVKVPYVSSTAALLTEEWTPLEPDVLDHKLYVRGIGNVLEQSVKGPSERNTLISVTRRWSGRRRAGRRWWCRTWSSSPDTSRATRGPGRRSWCRCSGARGH